MYPRGKGTAANRKPDEPRKPSRMLIRDSIIKLEIIISLALNNLENFNKFYFLYRRISC